MSHDIHHAKASWRLYFAAIALTASAIAIAATGILSRVDHEKGLQKRALTQDVTPVSVFSPQRGPSIQELVLPGSVVPYTEAPIYARVNGYVKSWNTDIGAHVKAGQLLCIIDTPELDQQIFRAEADLATAKANYDLANTTAKRWQNLLLTDSVSHQEADEKTGDAQAKLTVVNALRANLESLRAQQTFNHVVAPFDGVITDRKTDIGSLINAGSSGNSQALFQLAKIDLLRVYVEVPQSFSGLIKPGLTADLHFPEHPSSTFHAKLVSTSSAIHAESRTMTVELQMDNKDGGVLPGTYADVHFTLPTGGDVFRIPSSAVLFRKNGMEIATVGTDSKVVLKPVGIGRDLGNVVEVISGLSGSDQIIDTPSDSLAQGDKVRIAKLMLAADSNSQHAGNAHE